MTVRAYLYFDGVPAETVMHIVRECPDVKSECIPDEDSPAHLVLRLYSDIDDSAVPGFGEQETGYERLARRCSDLCGMRLAVQEIEPLYDPGDVPAIAAEGRIPEANLTLAPACTDAEH